MATSRLHVRDYSGAARKVDNPSRPAERAWETVDDLAPDEDAVSGADYRSLTMQLKAVGDQAPGHTSLRLIATNLAQVCCGVQILPWRLVPSLNAG